MDQGAHGVGLHRLWGGLLGVVALMMALGACAPPSPPPRPPASAPVAFEEGAVRRVKLLAEMWGHLEAGRAAAEAGRWEEARAHAGHPLEEVWPRVGKALAEAGVASTLRTALEGFQKAVAARSPDTPARGQEAISAVRQSLTAAAGTAWQDPAFRAQVVRDLLETVEEEYGEAVEGGRLHEPEEYQDAWGFFQVVRAFYSAIAGEAEARSAEAAHEIQEEMEALEKALASIQPPASPADPAVVKEAVGEVRAELAKAFNLAAVGPFPHPGAQGPRVDVEKELSAIRSLMEESWAAYQAGERDRAFRLARSAYLDHFELVEYP